MARCLLCMVKCKKFTSLFFVVIFINFYASTTLFSHSHMISDTAIAHSHLHAESHHDTKSGEHSIQGITFIAQISQLQSIDISHKGVPSPLQYALHKYYFVETTHWISSIYFQNLSLRAPPIM